MYDKQIYYIRASLKICPEGIKSVLKKERPARNSTGQPVFFNSLDWIQGGIPEGACR